MKKLFAAMAAATIMAVSVVPAFASVNSPSASAPVESPVVNSPIADGSSVSPQTGSNEALAMVALAASATICGAASIKLAKSAKRK